MDASCCVTESITRWRCLGHDTPMRRPMPAASDWPTFAGILTVEVARDEVAWLLNRAEDPPALSYFACAASQGRSLRVGIRSYGGAQRHPKTMRSDVGRLRPHGEPKSSAAVASRRCSPRLRFTASRGRVGGLSRLAAGRCTARTEHAGARACLFRFAPLETCCGNHETGERLLVAPSMRSVTTSIRNSYRSNRYSNTAANGPRVVRLALPSSTAAPGGCRIVSLRT